MILRLALAALTPLVLIESIAASTAQAAAPRIAVDPPTTTTGGQVAVYGAGFCATTGCSTVTITIGQRTAASGVKVEPDATFAAAATVTEGIGTYQVTATQTAPGGQRLQAVSQVHVAAGDQKATTTTAPATKSTTTVGSTPPNPPTTAPSSLSSSPPSATTTTSRPTNPDGTTTTTQTTANTKRVSAGPTGTSPRGGAIWPWVLIGIVGLAIAAGAGTAILRRQR